MIGKLTRSYRARFCRTNTGRVSMDKKDKEPKGTAATASKMAASMQPSGGESPSPDQGATGSQQQNQGTQNQNAGNQDLLQQAKQTTNEVVSQVQQQASSQFTR